MREFAASGPRQSKALARRSRREADHAEAFLRLQRSAGNAAVASSLGILRQSFGPPIMFSPAVRQQVELRKQNPGKPEPQDMVKTDPIQPGSGLAADKLRDARLEALRKGGPQPRSGDAPLAQQVDPSWRGIRELFDAGLPRRMVEHYGTGGGKEFKLSKADVVEVAPRINLAQTFSRGNVTEWVTNHIGLHREIASLKQSGGGTKHVAFQGTGQAGTHGTLGSFTILYDGELTVAKPGEMLDELGSTWHFKGTAVFYDVYNFDARTDRTEAAEKATWIGRNMMSGDPYQVVSEPVAVEQTENMLSAVVEGRSADGSGGKVSRFHPVVKQVLPDPMAGSGSSAGW